MYKYAIIDIETGGLSRYKHDINYIGIGFARELGEPLEKSLIYNMYKDRDLEKFKKTVAKLKERGLILIYQNGKFDTLFIQHKYGIKLPIHEDVMVMGTAYELNTSHALDDMAERYLGIPSWDIPLREKKKPNNPIVEKYLHKDLSVPWDLFCFFTENMDSQQWKVYKKLLRPAYVTYRDIENNGIYLDKKKLVIVKKQYQEQLGLKLAALNKKYPINWNSPAQVSDVLYKQEKLPVIKKTKKGMPSSDAKALKRLAAKGHELPSMLIDYKFYYGALTKFLNSWGDYAKFDGRIHPSFGITNVKTGRTSCSDPNLQQVPRNKELRTLYTAAPGRVLIEADYSQIELRIAAHLANEPTMIQIYKDGLDIHTSTAALVAGVAEKDVTKDHRTKAKPVNFGFLYGMWWRTFVDYAYDNYGVILTLEEAKRFRELFFIKYFKLEQWHKESEYLCELQGGVYNMFGQFIAFPDIYSHDKDLRSKAIRNAINSPTQSTASHLLVGSAIQIHKELRHEMDALVVGTIHDAVLVDVPERYVDLASKEIQRIMSRPKVMDTFGINLKVPLVADIGIGAWGSK